MTIAPIWRVAVAGPFCEPLDYRAPADTPAPPPGTRLAVPLGERLVVGVLVAVADHSLLADHRLKTVVHILDDGPLFDNTLFSLMNWAQRYYHSDFGDPFLTALPPPLRKPVAAVLSPRAAKAAAQVVPHAPDTPPRLTTEQQAALDAFLSHGDGFHCALLEGITGSGKTEIYLQLTAHALARQRQVLVLVPEIGLTPQLVERFRRRFAVPMALFHSRVTPQRRTNDWLLCAAGTARIAIGTRSAVFTPLPELGLVIVDEEHDPSFKQTTDFRYHGRDLAIVRGRLNGCLVVLGSATPALETLHNAHSGRYQHLHLRTRANTAALPTLRFLDMRREPARDGLALAALDALDTALQRGEQALIFINRRGFAPVLLCPRCGWHSRCDHCAAHLTLHRRRQVLRCHHCATETAIPTRCPACQHAPLRPVGTGTERLTQLVADHFAAYPHLQIDADHPAWLKRRDEIEQGTIPLLIGTQMFAKGHDFPRLRLVIVVGTDGALYSGDFRAAERLAQLVLQVAGRAGRRPDQAGQVWVQTQFPTHPLMLALKSHDYAGAAAQLLAERREMGLPPFAHQALLRVDSPRSDAAERFAQQAVDAAAAFADGTVEILGPATAPMERLAGRYRWQVLLQAIQRPYLQGFLAAWQPSLYKLRPTGQVRWSLDVDPSDLS